MILNFKIHYKALVNEAIDVYIKYKQKSEKDVPTK